MLKTKQNEIQTKIRGYHYSQSLSTFVQPLPTPFTTLLPTPSTHTLPTHLPHTSKSRFTTHSILSPASGAAEIIRNLENRSRRVGLAEENGTPDRALMCRNPNRRNAKRVGVNAAAATKREESAGVNQGGSGPHSRGGRQGGRQGRGKARMLACMLARSLTRSLCSRPPIDGTLSRSWLPVFAASRVRKIRLLTLP